MTSFKRLFGNRTLSALAEGQPHNAHRLGLGVRAQSTHFPLATATALFLALLFCEVPLLAQDQPDVSAGMNPISIYHGTDFDFVDLVTGRVSIHIPLVIDHS